MNRGGFDIVLLVGVTTVFDSELLATSQLNRGKLAVLDLFLSQLDRNLFATALGEHGIVHRQQIAGAHLDALAIDKLLDRRIDANLDRRAIELYIDRAVGVTDNSGDKQQKRTAHRNKSVWVTLVGTHVATSIAAAKALRMMQIRSPRLFGAATRRGRKLLTYGRTPIGGSFFIRGVGRGVLRQCVSPPLLSRSAIDVTLRASFLPACPLPSCIRQQTI